MKQKSARVLINRKLLSLSVLEAIAILVAPVWGAAAQNVPASPVSVQQTFRGVVANANERNDTLSIQLPSVGVTDVFKVQDGLIFNSVRYGDPVEITVETIDGSRTITGLKMQ